MKKECPTCRNNDRQNFEQKININVKNQYEKLKFKCAYDDEC